MVDIYKDKLLQRYYQKRHLTSKTIYTYNFIFSNYHRVTGLSPTGDDALNLFYSINSFIRLYVGSRYLRLVLLKIDIASFIPVFTGSFSYLALHISLNRLKSTLFTVTLVLNSFVSVLSSLFSCAIVSTGVSSFFLFVYLFVFITFKTIVYLCCYTKYIYGFLSYSRLHKHTFV